jgi:ketosteroid isomerase-like protein
MSQENVKLAQETLEAFGRRDVETMRRLNTPDIELDWSASLGIEAQVYRGFDEVLRFFAGYFEVFEELVFEEMGFIDAGESIVVSSVARSRGRGGIEASARNALLFTVRDGKISRICLYQETEQALKAVGLAE